jgi:arabinan endo-1,5-alpha-L-arabinosidase
MHRPLSLFAALFVCACGHAQRADSMANPVVGGTQAPACVGPTAAGAVTSGACTSPGTGTGAGATSGSGAPRGAGGTTQASGATGTTGDAGQRAAAGARGQAGASGAARSPQNADAGVSQGGTGTTARAGASGGGAAGSGGTSEYPAKTTQHLAIGVHDPAIIHAGANYYLLATGGRLGIRSSSNLRQWSSPTMIFSALPAWITTELGQQITDLWAPDISFFADHYHVYYAGSVFGSNHSVIGLATNTTLDPTSAGYAWVDQGLIIESNKSGGPKDDWNAIDPSLCFDTNGQPWLVFGSFWSGIKLRKVDAATGKLSTSDTQLHALANHSGGIEAASIVSHNGYYYLFVSYDTCCKGVNSTYRTMVGRASAITGPYADRNAKPMLQGNAEQLLASNGRYIGPGGGTAFQDDNLYYYAYHYYDSQANGSSYLMLRPMQWVDDWPMLDEPVWQ